METTKIEFQTRLIDVHSNISRETLINEPVVRITDEAGCNFQIDVGI